MFYSCVSDTTDTGFIVNQALISYRTGQRHSYKNVGFAKLMISMHIIVHTCTFHAVNLGVVLTLGAHAMFAFLPASQIFPYIIMVLMGIAYSLLACALWPLVSFIVPEYQLGTAYGM